MNALLISASPSEHSRSAALLAAAGQALERVGVRSQCLALRGLPAAPLLAARRADPAIAEALALLARSPVIVLATPIYKAAYSGLLKVFLDLLPQDGLHGKWVWSLATGGSAAHTLALDHSLRPVLDNLGAHPAAASVYALESQLVLRDDGHAAQIDADIERRLDNGADRIAHALELQRPLRERAPAASALALEAARCSA